MSEGVIKRITGRTPMVIRDLHAKPFEFSPAYKIFFDTNHLPSFRGQDQAIWNRLKRIPFRNVFSRQEQHIFRQTYGDLDALLAAEASGILRLAMAGWQEYQQAGRIIVPKSIESATTMYQQNEDELGQFLEDRCTAGSDCSVEKSELYQQYTEWSKENGDVLVTAKRFGMMMMEKGYRDAKRGSTRYWLGLRVNMTRKERDLHMFANARPAF